MAEATKMEMGNSIQEDHPEKNDKKKTSYQDQNTDKAGRPANYVGAPYNFVPFTPNVYQYPMESKYGMMMYQTNCLPEKYNIRSQPIRR